MDTWLLEDWSFCSGCFNIAAGVVCGVGVQIYTKYTINEAMEYSKAALSCNDQLPLAAGDAHDKVAEIIEEGGKGAVSHAKAILKSSGVSDQCVAIFELVCGKAQSFAAVDVIKEACPNLSV